MVQLITRLSDDTAQSSGIVGCASLSAYSGSRCAFTKKNTIAHHKQGYVCFLTSCEKKRCCWVHLLHAFLHLCSPAHVGGTSSTSGTNTSKRQLSWRGSWLGLSRALVTALWVFLCTNTSFIPFLPSKGISHQYPTAPPQPAIPIHTPGVLAHCHRYVPAPQ